MTKDHRSKHERNYDRRGPPLPAPPAAPSTYTNGTLYDDHGDPRANQYNYANPAPTTGKVVEQPHLVPANDVSVLNASGRTLSDNSRGGAGAYTVLTSSGHSAPSALPDDHATPSAIPRYDGPRGGGGRDHYRGGGGGPGGRGGDRGGGDRAGERRGGGGGPSKERGDPWDHATWLREFAPLNEEFSKMSRHDPGAQWLRQQIKDLRAAVARHNYKSLLPSVREKIPSTSRARWNYMKEKIGTIKNNYKDAEPGIVTFARAYTQEAVQ